MTKFHGLGRLVGFHCGIPEADWAVLCHIADVRSGEEKRRVSMAELVREAVGLLIQVETVEGLKTKEV